MSASTVSKVLNGRTDVSAATRARIEKLLHLHGYRRKNHMDSSSPLLDLVFYELGSLWSTEIVRGAENVASGAGLSLVLSEAADGVNVGQRWLDGVLARNPAGVILVTSGLDRAQQDQLTGRGIPFVVMDPAGDPGDDVPSIGSTNWRGGLAATRHLLSLGHRRIAVVSGPPRVMCSRARIDGYRAAMEEAGVPVDEELVQPGLFKQETGYAAGLKLLSMADRPTAVFTGNDLQAYGLYEAAWELGLRIPEDVSLVGFDDLTVSRWMGPSLTTVRQPLVQMAEAAVRLVIDLRRGAPELHRIDLATSLVVRSSTCPPPERVRPARPRRPAGTVPVPRAGSRPGTVGRVTASPEPTA